MTYRAKNKTFLTDHPEEFGSVAWSVKTAISWDNNKTIYAELRMADCNKHITLDFDFTLKSYKKRLAKLEVLIDELHDFRCHMIEAAKHIQPTKVY